LGWQDNVSAFFRFFARFGNLRTDMALGALAGAL
jgi:hypothetical protein